MNIKFENNFFILTGAMGAGKSTILKQLLKLGFMGVYEPARKILAEQRNINGNGLPDKDQKLFANLLLSRSISHFDLMKEHQGPVFFDRGIPDNIAYADLFGINSSSAISAANKYRYNNLVFTTSGWEEIYETDDERTMTFAEAREFGESVKNIYLSLGYSLLEIPPGDVDTRVKFILHHIEQLVPELH